MPEAADTLCDWIAVPSVTGAEASFAETLARYLSAAGFDVETMEVAPGRANVLARADRPGVVFCTHLDTVPGSFGPSKERGLVHGRGACDAKGPALAMIEAAVRLVQSKERRVGFLFTVGEEVDSIGAAVADRALKERAFADRWEPQYTIIGEPTDNSFVRASKGLCKVHLRGKGVAGHSSQTMGPSAVHELIGATGALLAATWGEDPILGPGTINVGTIRGGSAANVVAEDAEAEVLLRTVEDPEAVMSRIRGLLPERVVIDGEYKNYGPQHFHLPQGKQGQVVAFGTDAPHMPGWGTKLLYGPGLITDAHTDHERLDMRSFERAVHDYEATARELLQEVDAR